ncbi:hypothetical protein G6F57_013260 [Rhizopus arrhizus]|nr:hypothetical protein G6F57_013260 [Rhizopus arrhizus]
MHAQARAADRAQRIGHQARAEIGTADADADHVGHAAVFQRAHQHAHALADSARSGIGLGRHRRIDHIATQCGMQRGAAFGQVALFAAEQAIDGAADITLGGQCQQRLQRGGIVFLPGEVDVQRPDPQRQVLDAAGFGGEQAGNACALQALGVGMQRVESVVRCHAAWLRLEAVGFLLGHAGERGDDDDVTDLHVARGATVERDNAAAGFGADGIGREARTVGHVPDVHLLELADAGGSQQVVVDGDRAFVVQLGMGDGGAVDLGLEQGQVHGGAATAKERADSSTRLGVVRGMRQDAEGRSGVLARRRCRDRTGGAAHGQAEHGVEGQPGDPAEAPCSQRQQAIANHIEGVDVTQALQQRTAVLTRPGTDGHDQRRQPEADPHEAAPAQAMLRLLEQRHRQQHGNGTAGGQCEQQSTHQLGRQHAGSQHRQDRGLGKAAGVSGRGLHVLSPIRGKVGGARCGRPGAACGSEFQVVDQPGTAQARGNQRHAATAVESRLGQLRGAQPRVVDRETGRLQRGRRIGLDLRARLASHIAFAHAQQGAVKGGRDRTLFGAQVLVARTLGQAILVAHDLRPHDLDRERQLGHHLPDHGQLLVVLAAEHRHVRLHLQEQARHHRAHAIEVARAAGTLQHLAHARGVHLRGLVHAQRVHRLHAGQPHGVAADLLQPGHIGLGRTRVATEVFIGAELGRVDEDARHHLVGVLARQGHQRMMAAMQVAHGRHQCHAQAFALPLADLLAQCAELVEGLDHWA